MVMCSSSFYCRRRWRVPRSLQVEKYLWKRCQNQWIKLRKARAMRLKLKSQQLLVTSLGFLGYIVNRTRVGRKLLEWIQREKVHIIEFQTTLTLEMFHVRPFQQQLFLLEVVHIQHLSLVVEWTTIGLEKYSRHSLICKLFSFHKLANDLRI